MKTLIQKLFSNKKRTIKRKNRVSTSGASAVQLIKMAKLGQQLIVMSR